MQVPASWFVTSWPAANHDNPIRRGPANVITTFVLLPLAILVLGLRFYTRLRISKSFGIDDWLILASLCPAVAYSVLIVLCDMRYGWNVHIWDFWFPDATLCLKFSFALQLVFSASATLTKLSMLSLTRRLVVDIRVRPHQIITAAMGLVATQGVLFLLMCLFQCKNISDYWMLSFQPQSCVPQEKRLLAAGIVNTAVDFLVVVLPLPLVWGLTMPLQQQMIVTMLFGAGILATLAGAARVYYQFHATGASDITWALFPIWLSGTVELYVGIICASIPPTKDFFNRLWPKIFSSSSTALTISRTATPSPFRSIEPSDFKDLYRNDNIEYGLFELHDILEEPELHAESLEKRESSHSRVSSISSFNVSPPDRVVSLSTFNHASENAYAAEDSRSDADRYSRMLRSVESYGGFAPSIARISLAQDSLEHQHASFDFELRSVRSGNSSTRRDASSLFCAVRKVPSPSSRS